MNQSYTSTATFNSKGNKTKTYEANDQQTEAYNGKNYTKSNNDKNFPSKDFNRVISELVTPIAVSQSGMVYSNKVYLNESSKLVAYKSEGYLTLKGYVFSYQSSSLIPSGKIGLNKKMREFLTANLIDDIKIQLYQPKTEKDRPASSLTLKIQLLFAPQERVQIDDKALAQHFVQNFQKFYISEDQTFVVDFSKTQYFLTISNLFGAGDGPMFLTKSTKIQCIASSDQKIKLKSAKQVKKNIFAQNFSLQTLGIGGLDDQLMSIFRRAFASRRLPHSLIEKFGIKHVKGILLFGPPGTGKTLIARQLAHALKAKSFTKVDGPQIFSKYVGESEQNIRKAFQPARDDEIKYGDQSQLHVIVFDEIDAICRQRGSDNSGSNAKDAVVNQLLTNLDGVQALNNVIVIGMTNRKDLLDEAILRPGRLQVHVEIGIPNEDGRKQILQIHTRTLEKEKLLDNDVSLSKLAFLTKNYTGAELQAIVKNASSYAMTKGNDVMDFSKNFTLQKDTKVNMKDFERAILEVPPSFGIDQQNFQVYTREKLIPYGKSYQNILNLLNKVSNIVLTQSKQLVTLLMHGPQGSGKTSIAAHFAKQSKFTYVKLISPQRYVGIQTQGRINSIIRIFTDAYKCSSSLIIIDNIERLLQFVKTGPDFNNSVMQTLFALLNKTPPNPDCKLMVIGTSSNYQAIQLLDVNKRFGLNLKVSTLNQQQCDSVLQASIGIKDAPIKKLIQFKQICKYKPKSSWKKLWMAFNQDQKY